MIVNRPPVFSACCTAFPTIFAPPFPTGEIYAASPSGTVSVFRQTYK